MQRRRLTVWAAALIAALCAPILPSTAGTIGLQWDAAPAAIGYRVQVSDLDAGTVSQVDLPTAETTHELSVDDATSYAVCVRAVRADGVASFDCSNEVVGWPAPRIESVRLASAAIDGASGSVRLSLELDGGNFHPDGGLLLDDSSVGVVEAVRSSSTRIDAVLALPAGTAQLPALTLDAFNTHPQDDACAPTGEGCPTASVRLALEVDALVNGLFSIAGNLNTTGGTLFHYIPYVVPAAGETPTAATASFLPWTVGLTALDLEPDGSLLFGVDRTATIGSPLTTVQRSGVYRRDPSGAIELSHDFLSGGPGLSRIAAAARLEDGRWLVVPALTSNVIVDGISRTLSPSSVYRFDPISGAVEEVFAGGPIGTGALDAVDQLADGRLAVSTASHPFIWQDGALVRLWGMNAYAVGSQSGTLETLLDGVAMGLNGLDALSLGASVNASVTILEEVVEPPAALLPWFSPSSNGFATWGQYLDRRVYELSADGSSAAPVVADLLPWQAGIDALDRRADDTLLFSVNEGVTVATESGQLTLAPGRVYRVTISGSIETVQDDVGLALGLDDLDALHVREDGSVWFSTSAHEWVSLGGGVQQLLHWRVYAWRAGATQLEVVLDLKSRGVDDLDAVHALVDGRIVFSTATSPFVPDAGGLQRLWSQSAWAWDPETDSIELWLDGTALDLGGLDAVTLSP